VILNGSGVNLAQFPQVSQPEQPVFLCISRLIRDKGVMEYLEACRQLRKRHPEVRCLLVGPFDTNPSAITKEELQSFTEDGSVEYMGEQKNVQPFLAQCSVYVLPSYHEGTPKTVLEAMATGRPILTTDAPGCRQTVTQGENGLLVPVKSVPPLVEAMEQLIANPQLCRQMGQKSRVLAEERYDVRKINHKILNTMKLIP
jgi:glycosyltransferase involved in cell wall biosynthesis